MIKAVSPFTPCLQINMTIVSSYVRDSTLLRRKWECLLNDLSNNGMHILSVNPLRAMYGILEWIIPAIIVMYLIISRLLQHNKLRSYYRFLTSRPTYIFLFINVESLNVTFKLSYNIMGPYGGCIFEHVKVHLILCTRFQMFFHTFISW